MNVKELIIRRLVNQQLIDSQLSTPQEVVQWLGAMQAQEYTMAKWAIGLRLPGSKESDIEAALNNGSILRTHLMRPTWHFVAPEDIRWLLKLTAPYVHKINAYVSKQNDLTPRKLSRAADLLISILEGGKQLTRDEISTELKKKRVTAKGLRLICILMYAELEGIICSGPRKGKQFTYTLLEERVPAFRVPDRDESFILLLSKYLQTRGPATIQDFCWWSGLPVKETKEVIQLLKPGFTSTTIDGKEYWYAEQDRYSSTQPIHKKPPTFLMPDYDEYGISYKDRSALLPAGKQLMEVARDTSIFNHWVIVDGIGGGIWNRVVEKRQLKVKVSLDSTLSQTKRKKVDQAVKDYIRFFDLP